jgi:aspartyl-tRNA(Asn)/glutamyl-tRNA(Gln) amidotransferase subunit C
MTIVDRDAVLNVARLASLSLREDEVEPLANDLAAIVRYVEQLGELDLGGVPPTLQVGEGAGLREDEPRAGLSHEEALAAAPRVEGGGFSVPTFVEP